MFYSTLLIATAALSGLVSAQNYSTSGPIAVTPGSISAAKAATWCANQKATCPLICGGQAYPNTCDPTQLTYVCTCTDGSKPNISDYSNTLPSLECGQWISDCVKAHPKDLSGQQACLTVTCGNKSAADVHQSGVGGHGGSSSVAPSSSATGGSGSKPTKTGSSAASSSSATGAAVALSVARNYGTGILAGGLLAVFGLAL